MNHLIKRLTLFTSLALCVAVFVLTPHSALTAQAPTPTSPLLAIPTTPAPTAAPTVVPVEAGGAPQLTLTLPEGWQAAYGRVPIRTALDEVRMNVAIYRGVLANGTGTIVVLWGFPQIAAPPRTGDPTSAAPETLRNEMLWSDGLRLLQGTLVDITCNVGTSGQRTFKVGGVEGVGTFFNVSQCQGEPETAGWFVGVSQYGRSYLFYAYIEPITAYNDARAALQAILDSVKFLPTAATKTPGTLLPTTTPLVTPTATPAG